MADAIYMLKSDHEKVRALLEKLTDSGKRATKARADLLDQIGEELRIHTTIEEEIFYPAFRDADGTEHREMTFEAREEHRAVEKLVLPDLEKTDPGDDAFAGRAKVLRELIEHHADEEEDDMFKKARKALSREELEKLGTRMAARKKELQESAKS